MKKRMSHEQSMKLAIVDAPSMCPSGQIIISFHCIMVSLPSFINISVGGEFDKGDPVFVGLHIIGICEGALWREMRVVQSVLSCCQTKQNLFVLQVIIVVYPGDRKGCRNCSFLSPCCFMCIIIRRASGMLEGSI